MALAHRLFQDFAQGVANAKCHNLRRGASTKYNNIYFVNDKLNACNYA